MTTVTTIDRESELLEVFKKIDLNNSKKVLKLARKLHGTVIHEIQKVFCMEVILSADPSRYIKHCIAVIEDFATLTAEAIANGNHGVMFVGKYRDVLIPVKLDVLPQWLKADEPWHPDDERQIMTDAAMAYMHERGLKTFQTKVVLFPQYGFSGEPLQLDLKLTKETK